MQIPTNFSAAQAVSIASVVSTRDKNVAQTGASPEAATVQAQLEKSESSNPDRDAQGQGDGLGPHDRKRHSPEEATASEANVPQLADLPAMDASPDDPPSELDMVC